MRTKLALILLGLLILLAPPAMSQEHGHIDFACKNNRRNLVTLPSRYQGHRALAMVCEWTQYTSSKPRKAEWWITDSQILYVWCENDDHSFAKNQVVTIAWFSRRWVKAVCFTKSYWRTLSGTTVTLVAE